MTTFLSVRPAGAVVPPSTASRDDLLWLYRQIIRMHTEQPATVEARDPATDRPWPYRTHGVGCAHCPPGGGECRYLVWARAELAARRADG